MGGGSSVAVLSKFNTAILLHEEANTKKEGGFTMLGRLIQGGFKLK